MTPLVGALVFAAAIVSGPGFDLQGHRGARGLVPENTLAGFRRTLEIGVTTLEMDAGVTRDGVVVLTAVLGGSDQLRPPLVPPPAEQRGCFFAFVDEASTPRRGSTPRRAAPPRGGGTSGGAAVDGTWTLLPLRGAMPFGANQRRNSRVPPCATS